MIELTNVVEVIQLIYTLLTAAILIYSLKMTRDSLKMTRESLTMARETKSLDIIMECEKRYSDVIYEQAVRAENGEIKLSSYYEMYWNLQVDQFQFWQRKYIVDEVYRRWMSCRRDEWNKNDALSNGKNVMDYRQGWHYAVKKLCLKSCAPSFVEFMERIFKGDIEGAFKSCTYARTITDKTDALS